MSSRMRPARSPSSAVKTLAFSEEEDDVSPTRVNAAEVFVREKQLFKPKAEDYLTRTEQELAILTNESLRSIRVRKGAILDAFQLKPLSLSNIAGLNTVRLPLGVALLDHLLNGGLPSSGGEILEVKGPSGVGKSQLCMTISRTFGHVHKEKVLYIDTCNGVDISRFHQIFCKGDCDNAEVTADLRNVSIVKATNIQALLTTLDVIEVMREPSRFSLVIIDSFAHLILPLNGKKNPTGHAVTDVIVGILRRIVRNQGTNIVVTTFAQRQDDGSLRTSLGAWWSFTAHHVFTLEPSFPSGHAECTLEASFLHHNPGMHKGTIVVKESGSESQ